MAEAVGVKFLLDVGFVEDGGGIGVVVTEVAALFEAFAVGTSYVVGGQAHRFFGGGTFVVAFGRLQEEDVLERAVVDIHLF